MTHETKFPITLVDAFPVHISPECNKVAVHTCESECFFLEGDCQCSGESEIPDEENELYKIGHPFYKTTQKETSPTLKLLENFTKEDFCNLNTTALLEKIRKNGWNHVANHLCFQLIMEALVYAKKCQFNIKQCLALMEMFYSMFKYFMITPLLAKRDFYKYFRDLLLLYSVQDAPESLRIFNPVEGFAIAYKFSTFFDRNFDLLRAVLFSDSEIVVNIENL